MAKLATYVTVHHPDTGESATFGPDDSLPAWAAKAITNPDVWENGDSPDQTPEPPVVEQPAGNASREAWAEYAATKGASEDELKDPAEGGLSRDDLRAKYGA